MKKYKAKLRAWLIDLVREAIRVEFPVVRDSIERAVMVRGKVPTVVYIDPEPNPATIQVEPSFEQMQADALKAQEEFYEPKRA